VFRGFLVTCIFRLTVCKANLVQAGETLPAF